MWLQYRPQCTSPVARDSPFEKEMKEWLYCNKMLTYSLIKKNTLDSVRYPSFEHLAEVWISSMKWGLKTSTIYVLCWLRRPSRRHRQFSSDCTLILRYKSVDQRNFRPNPSSRFDRPQLLYEDSSNSKYFRFINIGKVLLNTLTMDDSIRK